MAQTAAAVQAQLGTKPTDPTIVAELAPYGSTKQYWVVRGGVAYPGKSMMVDTTAANSAANQATEITTALTGAANSDPY